MHLVTVDVAGKACPGVIVGNDILNLSACSTLAPTESKRMGSVKEILAGGKSVLDDIRRLMDRATGGESGKFRDASVLLSREKARLLPPIPDPGMILACGVNYHQHLKEMNTPVPGKPMSFIKNVASLVGSGSPIIVPPSNPNMVDWEGEFCVVIGRSCHAVKESEALSYVGGYTLLNDVSARDWVTPVFASTGIMGPIQAWEHNILGKQFPTFCPMGPAIATPDEIKDPHDVDMTTTLNGKVMQSSNTNDFVFNVVQVIAYYSQFYRFQPGDVISMGSPSGVGFARKPQIFMKPGDLVEVKVDRIGTLSNPIRAS
jgi:acylpyruvate hydrolase